MEDENVSLRSKLSHSRALCAALTARLNALGQSVDSLLQQLDQQPSSKTGVTSSLRGISALKRQLQDTRNMTSNLSVSLKRKCSIFRQLRSLQIDFSVLVVEFSTL